jgi:hypothetical protein
MPITKVGHLGALFLGGKKQRWSRTVEPVNGIMQTLP